MDEVRFSDVAAYLTRVAPGLRRGDVCDSANCLARGSGEAGARWTML